MKSYKGERLDNTSGARQVNNDAIFLYVCVMLELLIVLRAKRDGNVLRHNTPEETARGLHEVQL